MKTILATRRFGDGITGFGQPSARRRPPIKCQLPAGALLGAAVLRCDREALVEGGRARRRVLDLPGGRSSGRGGAGEVLGCRWSRLRAGRARRRAIRPAHHRPHQRRIESQCAMVRGDKFEGSQEQPTALKGQKHPSDDKLDRRTTLSAIA